MLRCLKQVQLHGRNMRTLSSNQPHQLPWLFLGLGNPGLKFQGTRHNVGFEMIDALSEKLGISVTDVHCKALFGQGFVGDVPVFLAKPQTYMNLSGESTGPLAAYYKLPLNRVIVFHDDMELPCGVLRLQPKGGHGSHNGLKSVIDHFRGNREFARLRIGIGRPPGQMDPKAFLLQKFNNLARERESIWKWKGFSIRYQCCGDTGPALVLIHGFGANSDHWRKNVGALAKSHRVYAIDLIGYGYSDKPNPRDFGDTPFYTFQTWASQLNDFCQEVVQDKAFFICNSIGGLVGLEAAVMEPQICRGLLLLNISLRMLHIKKQPALARPLIKSFQSLLRDTALGKYFFRTVATTQSVRNILCQCYNDTSQVTDELVEKILLPGLQPGAVDVFLEFICYSDGPLPEELLPQVKCPVLIAWGDKDPWEPIELGRAYGNFETVEEFVVLPDVGHCPQDEAPQLVNPLVESFVARHSTSRAESCQ